MNKKLIAAAVAAVMAAPVVSAADTTLYGVGHVDIRNTDAANDIVSVNSNASRLGVKGSEDLGNGLKAIFGFEFQVDVDDNDGINAARNTFVGLSGGFGTFLVGRHDTPAKIAFNNAKLSVVSDSIVDFEASMGFTEFRLDNAIAYVSPSFSGFTVAAAVVPGEQTGVATTTTTWTPVGAATNTSSTNTNANAGDGLTDAYSLGLMYSGGGLKAGLSYEVAKGGMTLGSSGSAPGGTVIGANDHKMWQASASYTFGDFMVGAGYESTDNNAGGAVDKEVWALHARANFGNNYVAANYGQSEVGATDTDSLGLIVGHKFSKRTQVYAAYDNNDVDGGVETDTFALGMVHTF